MITPQHAKRLPKRMSQLILLGFAVLIGLMTVLVVNSVRALKAQEDRLIEMVETRNRKIQLATDLLNATHNRHNSLTYQVIVEDPFEQDEHFQQYIKWGFEVGKARNALREMPLDSFEGESLARQDRLIEVIVDLHDRISDLARQGRQAEARTLISDTLRPYNLEFTSSVSQLEQYERELNQQAFDATRLAGQRAAALSIGLGVTLLLLSVVIAWITYRLMSRYSQTICEQMHALEKTGVQLKHEATHDPLTGLPNRSLFYHRLMEALAFARLEGIKATVIYVDLDQFKPVNDRHGHAVGDSLLQVVAGRLLSAVRATDTVARLGGDEFAIILLGVGEPERVARIIEELQQAVRVPVQLDDLTLQSECSCGHATYPEDGDGMDTLLHTADLRMYEAKRQRSDTPAA